MAKTMKNDVWWKSLKCFYCKQITTFCWGHLGSIHSQSSIKIIRGDGRTSYETITLTGQSGLIFSENGIVLSVEPGSAGARENISSGWAIIEEGLQLHGIHDTPVAFSLDLFHKAEYSNEPYSMLFAVPFKKTHHAEKFYVLNGWDK